MPRLEAVIFDWAGTTVDHGCMAPVASFMEVFRRRGVPIEDVFEPRCEVGFGIEARAGKRRIRIGSERFMAAEKLPLSARAKQVRTAANERGHSLVYVASGKRVVMEAAIAARGGVAVARTSALPVSKSVSLPST